MGSLTVFDQLVESTPSKPRRQELGHSHQPSSALVLHPSVCFHLSDRTLDLLNCALPQPGGEHCKCPSAQHIMQRQCFASLRATSRPDSYSTSGQESARCPCDRHRWHHSYLRVHSDGSCPCSEQRRHLLKMQSELSWSLLPHTQQRRRTFSFAMDALCSSARGAGFLGFLQGGCPMYRVRCGSTSRTPAQPSPVFPAQTFSRKVARACASATMVGFASPRGASHTGSSLPSVSKPSSPSWRFVSRSLMISTSSSDGVKPLRKGSGVRFLLPAVSDPSCPVHLLRP